MLAASNVGKKTVSLLLLLFIWGITQNMFFYGRKRFGAIESESLHLRNGNASPVWLFIRLITSNGIYWSWVNFNRMKVQRNTCSHEDPIWECTRKWLMLLPLPMAIQKQKKKKKKKTLPIENGNEMHRVLWAYRWRDLY